MAFPSLSQRTPRESPTLATVNSLSDSRATRHVVPETDGGERGGAAGDQRKMEKKEQERGGGERSCTFCGKLIERPFMNQITR